MADCGAKPGVLALAAALAAMIVLAGALLWLSRDLPENVAQVRQLGGTDFNFVIGSGKTGADRVIVDGFDDGYALLSSGPLNVKASDYRYLRITVERPASSIPPTFFWRQSNAPEQLDRLFIQENGTSLNELTAIGGWRGEFSEIGLLIQGTAGERIAVGPVILEPDRLATRLQNTWSDWSAFEPWTQRSINYLTGGRSDQALPLPPLVIAWIALTAAFAWLLTRSWQKGSGDSFFSTMIAIFMIGWMILDLRWTVNCVRQITQTVNSYWRIDEDQRLAKGLDGEIFLHVKRLKTDVLSLHPARILIVGDESTAEYLLQRTKYHLLPHSAYASRGFLHELKPDNVDYVISLIPQHSSSTIPAWQREWKNGLKLLDSSKLGEVFIADH